MYKCLYSDEIVISDMQEIIADNNIYYEHIKNSTVLVTGATGMLAYYCVCALMYMNDNADANIKVIALVRNEKKARKKFGDLVNNKYFELLVQDVCEPIQIEENVDYIIHAAGSASPSAIKSNPLGIIRANLLGTMNICEFAKQKSVKKILYTSTREVYGEVKGITYISETDMGVLNPLDSRSCYPESKRMSEQILKSYNVQYGVPYTVARIAHVYGPGMETENDGRVMSDFVSDVIHNRDIILKSEGTAERAFCYITDAIRGMFYVLLNGKITECYNLANETEPMMIRDVARLMVETFPEKAIEVRFELQENNGGYCNYIRVGLDTKKLETLGWKAEVTLQDGIKRTIKSFE